MNQQKLNILIIIMIVIGIVLEAIIHNQIIGIAGWALALYLFLKKEPAEETTNAKKTKKKRR